MPRAQDETRKLLAYVSTRMGGVEKLAAKLQISSTVLTLYITGERPIPDPLILRVVDVLLQPAGQLDDAPKRGQ